MGSPFRDMFDGLNQTADGLIAASDGLIAANRGIKKTVEAALQASEDHEDLRETVQRLEGLVMNQTQEIQQLRERLNGGSA
jgi:uncharacterized phage infection (PIP) family protein YhgE